MLSKFTFPHANQAISVTSFTLKTSIVSIVSRFAGASLWGSLLCLMFVSGSSSSAFASDDNAFYWDPASYAAFDEELKFILGPTYKEHMEYPDVPRNPIQGHDLERWYIDQIRMTEGRHPSIDRLMNFADHLIDTNRFRIRLQAAPPREIWGRASYNILNGEHEAYIEPGMYLKLLNYRRPRTLEEQTIFHKMALRTFVHETRHARTTSWMIGHLRRHYGITLQNDILQFQVALNNIGNTHTDEWIAQKADRLLFHADRKKATREAKEVFLTQYPLQRFTAGVSLKELMEDAVEMARNQPDFLEGLDENDGEIDNPFAKCYRKAQPISALGRALNSGTGRLAVGAGVGGNLALMSLAGDAAPLVEYGMLHGQYISSLGVSAGSYIVGAAPTIGVAGLIAVPIVYLLVFNAVAPSWDPYWDYRGISDQQGIMLNNRFSTISCHNVWLRGGH